MAEGRVRQGGAPPPATVTESTLRVYYETLYAFGEKPAHAPLNNLFSGCLVVPFIPICLVVSLADPRRDFPELSKKQRNIMETRIQFKDLNSEVPATNCH